MGQRNKVFFAAKITNYFDDSKKKLKKSPSQE